MIVLYLIPNYNYYFIGIRYTKYNDWKHWTQNISYNSSLLIMFNKIYRIMKPDMIMIRSEKIR